VIAHSRIGAMALRRFVDATGVRWEVFHVRWKANDQAVAAALGAGWLSFVSATEKRRSQVVPAGWAALPDAELERLRAAADVVRPVRTNESSNRESGSELERSAEPRPASENPQSRRARGPRLTVRQEPLGRIVDAAPDAPSTAPPDAAAQSVSPAEEAVRAFARSARERQIPVLDAAVQLKRELDDRGEPTTREALKVARRWFIDSYYFDQRV
jgi:hypothetical protein